MATKLAKKTGCLGRNRQGTGEPLGDGCSKENNPKGCGKGEDKAISGDTVGIPKGKHQSTDGNGSQVVRIPLKLYGNQCQGKHHHRSADRRGKGSRRGKHQEHRKSETPQKPTGETEAVCQKI